MEKALSRKGRIKLSIVFLIAARVLIFLLGFISRRLIVNMVGTEYLGLNSLFANILDLLNLAELGLGTAIEVILYKPLVDGDKTKIKSIVSFANRLYTIIFVIVLAAGAILTPFVPSFIKETTLDPNFIRIVFFVSVVATSLSYLLIEKRIINSANEYMFVNTFCDAACRVGMTTIALIQLHFTKNYIVYMGLVNASAFVSNLVLMAIPVNRVQYRDSAIDKNFRKETGTKVGHDLIPLIPHKLSLFVFASTDAIIISAIIGITSVATYSNYMLVVNGALGIASVISTSLVATFGKMIAEGKSDEEIYHSFYKYSAIQFVFSALVAIGLYALLDQFVLLWMGDASFVLPFAVMAVIVGDFYLHSMYQPMSTVYTAYHRFKEDAFVSVGGAVINIGVSILCGYYWGLLGVIAGTLFSNIFIYICRVLVVVKSIFKKNPLLYFARDILLFAVAGGAAVLLRWLTNDVWPFEVSIGSFILCVVIVSIASVIISGVFVLAISRIFGERLDIGSHFLAFLEKRPKVKKLLKIAFAPVYLPFRLLRNKRRDAAAVKHLSLANSVIEGKKGEYNHIVFICQCEHIFDKFSSLVDLMSKDESCIVTLFIVPEHDLADESESRNSIFAKYENERVRKVFYKDGDESQLERLEPNYVFFARPYNNYLPDYLSSRAVSAYAKTCHISYAYLMMEIEKVSLNPDFTRYLNFLFASNSFETQYFDRRYSHRELQRSFVYGYPALEDIANGYLGTKDCTDAFDAISNKTGFKVIWTPRWTVDKSIGGSNFFRYIDLFIEKIVFNLDYRLVFRPHPFAFSNYISKGLLSEAQATAYKKAFDDSENAHYDDSHEYIKTFFSSDCLVTDVSSIIPEYLLTGKPIVFCHNKGDADNLNFVAKEMCEVMYEAHSFEDIERYLEMIRQNNDPLLDRRMAYRQKLIEDNKGACERIFKEIREDFRRITKESNNG